MTKQLLVTKRVIFKWNNRIYMIIEPVNPVQMFYLLRNLFTVQGVAVQEDCQVGRVYLSVGGESFGLLVGQ